MIQDIRIIKVFNEKNSENAIEIFKDKNNFFDLKLGFENFEINVDEFFGIFLFFQSFKQNKEQKIFKENLIELRKNEHEDIKNQDITKFNNFSFKNNFKLSNIPYLSILVKNNKIDLKIFNYSLNENSINFSISLNDSFGKIINDLPFNMIKEDKNIITHLETPIEIFIRNETLSTIVLNYFAYKIELLKENKLNVNNNNFFEKSNKLFHFKFDFKSSILYAK